MKVYIIGIGPGSRAGLTLEALGAIEESQILIGAKRMTEGFEEGKEVYNSYRPGEIGEFIRNYPKEGPLAVLLSGDTGFYSGAGGILEEFDRVREGDLLTQSGGGLAEEKNLLARDGREIRLCLLPGLSSLAVFCARLGIGYEDVKLLSLHGRNANAIGYIKNHKKVFMLLSSQEDIYKIAARLEYYGMTYVKIHIGSRLGYEDERLLTCSVNELLPENKGKIPEIDKLSVALFENPKADERIIKALADEDFIRGRVPMTKAEVRSLSISKLSLMPDSVLYDIGAGSGSVSIEAAGYLPEGRVYAIERNAEAAELIEANIRKFAADNVSLIRGEAPEALKLPEKPSHAFIGGSGGNLREIIRALWQKNKDIRIVINAVSLETIALLTDFLREEAIEAEVLCVNTARAKSIGEYHLMQAMNPVYIFAFTK